MKKSYILIACILLITITAPLSSAQAEDWVVWDDFESGNLDGWETGTSPTIDDEIVFEGQYSMRIPSSSASPDARLGIPNQFEPEAVSVVRIYVRPDGHVDNINQPATQIRLGNENEERLTRIRHEDDDGDGDSEWTVDGTVIRDNASIDSWVEIIVEFDYADNTFNVLLNGTEYATNFPIQNSGGVGHIQLGDTASTGAASNYDSIEFREPNRITGIVENLDNEPLENVNITVESDGNEIIDTTTNTNGQYELFLANGDYNFTASSPRYINHTRENISIDSDRTINFELINRSEAINFNVQNWMEHGSTQTWEMEFTNRSGTFDITDETIVLSGNTTVLTTEQVTNEITATSDTSINKQSYVYTEYDNTTFYENITVANRTIDNIGVMPSSEWVPTVLGYGEDQASFGIGSEIQWILVAIAIGATAAWSAKNEWMGVGVIVASITLFWVLGRVDLSIMLTALFYGILAGYQLQQTPSRSDTDVGGNLSNPFE